MPFEQFIIFFLLLLLGFFCKKLKIFNDAAVSGINAFIINVAYPCLILVRTTALDMDPRIFSNFMLVLFMNLGLLLLFACYARLYFKGARFPTDIKPTIEFAGISSNNGFMGFPIAITIFGDLGLLYMVACNIALNMFFFTFGIKLLKRGREIPGEALAKKIKEFFLMVASPKVSAAIAGIILCYAGVVIPGAANEFLAGVGAVATPMAMISIGTMLAGNFGPRSFTKRAVVEPMLNKLFIVPVIAAAVVMFLPLDPLVKVILVVSNALPTATTVPILCERFDRNKGLASEILVVGTLFSLVTIPLCIWILQHTVL